MTYNLEGINTLFAEIAECMHRNPARAMRLLGQAKAKVREALEHTALAAHKPNGGYRGAIVSAFSIANDIEVQRARQMDGPDRWAVRRRGECLSIKGEWAHEPLPSNRSDGWIATHRFATSKEAIDAAISTRQRKEGK